MRMFTSISEIADIFREIHGQLRKLFKMIRYDINGVTGKYPIVRMTAELSRFWEKGPYVRVAKGANHNNGSYGRDFALKSIKVSAIGVFYNRRHNVFLVEYFARLDSKHIVYL